MKLIINYFRNKFESSQWGRSLLNIITKNKIYKNYIYKLSEKKISATETSRKYDLAIEITGFCNARCTFCPNSTMKRQKSTMSMVILQKIIDRIKEESIKPTFFNLGPNGEPLIDKELFKKVRLLHKNFPDTKIFFPTNLSLATTYIQRQLVESDLDNICVSLNANRAKDYRKIMSLDYQTTINNLKNLIKLRNKTNSKLKIYLKLAANPVNKSTINAFIRKWDKKVDGIGISWIHSWAGAVDNQETASQKIPKYPCRTLFEQINIQADGNIVLCCVDYEGKVVGGNVMNQKILESINNHKINQIKNIHRSGQIDKIKMCSQCRFCERGLYWLAK